MLKHGLQEIHESKIVLPRNVDLQPDPEALTRRFEEFEQANR